MRYGDTKVLINYVLNKSKRDDRYTIKTAIKNPKKVWLQLKNYI